MHSAFTIAVLALSASLGVSGQASSAAQLVSSLKTAATANDRLNLLKSDSDVRPSYCLTTFSVLILASPRVVRV